MRESLLFDGPLVRRKLTRFWVLLALASVIAAAGVVADSTATVIGAMIVAPLMTPILGAVYSVALADARNLARSVALIVSGSALVVLLGVVFGVLTPVDITAETSSQVAGRVSPRLVDLIAALATGAVGAFALVREDVSDTLPGVAIAISLVPPLAVVGLTLESGTGSESLGALLLFLTNVGAILLSGLAVMWLYRVHRASVAAEPASPRRLSRGGATVLVIVFVAVLAVPLAASSARVAADAFQRQRVADVAREWAVPAGWDVVSVEPDADAVRVRVEGSLPAPSPEALRELLDAQGLFSVDVHLELVPKERVDLPAGGDTES
jgi:uncharacterized hydrophobic protein (TIGR00271 family)